MVFTLTWVTLVAAVGLGFVYEITREPIEQARLKKQLKAIESVIPGYDNNPVEESEKVRVAAGADSLEFFPAKKAGELIGVAVKARSRKGYSGDIWLMVGFAKDGTIGNISVVAHQETPGLGSKMSDDAFLKQFISRNPSATDLRVKKDGGTVDAISGATISSRAFSEAVIEAHKTWEKSAYGKD